MAALLAEAGAEAGMAADATDAEGETELPQPATVSAANKLADTTRNSLSQETLIGVAPVNGSRIYAVCRNEMQSKNPAIDFRALDTSRTNPGCRSRNKRPLATRQTSQVREGNSRERSDR
jgi:hypothetical protein